MVVKVKMHQICGGSILTGIARRRAVVLMRLSMAIAASIYCGNITKNYIREVYV
jgi:hypothetical protein